MTAGAFGTMVLPHAKLTCFDRDHEKKISRGIGQSELRKYGLAISLPARHGVTEEGQRCFDPAQAAEEAGRGRRACPAGSDRARRGECRDWTRPLSFLDEGL